MSLKFPEELLQPPRCLIAISGLDVRNNAVHRAVWDEFTQGGRRNERKPVLYRNMPPDHLYPKASDPTNYEDCKPIGILKTNWLYKQCQEMPSLVVFFYDLDWDDLQWEEREMECASKIQVIRAALEGRATEIVIVLLQTTPPVPIGDPNSQTSERAAALCSLCCLPRLNLFALPFTDRPLGFIIRLEDAFYKKSLQYYSHEISKIKAHKEVLTKQSQMHPLVIRHQFKIAFYTEMKDESTNALKLYQSAYNNLLDTMYLNEDRIMEFKIIAGFLNYKICQLCFIEDEPLTAIQQFRRHMDRFGKEMGSRPLSFQHHEWMSRQFSAFADIFSEAVKRGLKAIQTQNPGLYYHQAALSAIARKRLSHKLCLEASTVPLSELATLPEPVYYGQRPWRLGLTDEMSSNKDKRLSYLRTMQAHEYKTEHSWLVIPLLSKAVSHFKDHNSERMISLLKVLMGEEYYQVKEYEKALVLLRGVIEAYRREQWWKALSSVLQTLLRCAYLLGYLQDYFLFSLELISYYIPIPVEEKTRIQQNVLSLFSGQAPDPEPGVPHDAQVTAYQLWADEKSSKQPGQFTIQASSRASFIECKTVFTKSSFSADSPIALHVHIRSSAPLPVTLTNLTVLFYQEQYNHWCRIDSEFTLEPCIAKCFSFSFPVIQSSVGDRLEVHAVEAVLGREGEGGGGRGRAATLVWSNGVSERFTSLPQDPPWRKIRVRNSTLIKHRTSSLDITVDHHNPALTSEYFPLTVSVVNKESCNIRDLVISVAMDTTDKTSVDGQATAELYATIPQTPTVEHKKQSVNLSCGLLESDSKFSETIFLSAHTIGERKLTIHTSYSIETTVKETWEPVICVCQKSLAISVTTVKPFDVTYKLMSTKFKVIDAINFDEPFILVTEIHCLSPWKLYIDNSSFDLPQNVKNIGNNTSQIRTLELGPQDKASEVWCLLAPSPHSHITQSQDTSLSFGTYTVRWKRSSSSDPESSVMTSTVTLPPILIHTLSFSISTDIPANGTLHHPFPVSYIINNKTQLIQEIEARISTSDAFMYSGKRHSRFRVLPSGSHTLTYNLYPVAAGMVALPHLDLTSQRHPNIMETITKNQVPTSIFIKPSSVCRDSDTTDISSLSSSFSTTIPITTNT